MTLEERCKLATDCLPLAEYRTRLEALHTELLALRKNDERYRWLTRNPTWLGWEHDFRPDEVEREIDAAMAGQG